MMAAFNSDKKGFFNITENSIKYFEQKNKEKNQGEEISKNIFKFIRDKMESCQNEQKN